MPTESVYNAFFRLLKVAVGSAEPSEALRMPATEWQALLKEASRHKVLGATFPAVVKLFDSSDMPTVTYISWEKAANKTRLYNQKHRAASAEVYKFFTDNGFRCCILKGDASAAYYPEPEFRQNGDIDIWVEGQRDALFSFLNERFPLKKTTYVHTETKMRADFEVEVHYTPSWMYSPISNRRLQKWFLSRADGEFVNFDEKLGCCVPTDRFNGTYMLLHIFRHLFFEGIGFRQVMDYYFVLTKMSEADRDDVRRNVRSLGIGRFTSALIWVMAEVFGLDSKYFLCEPSARTGKTLLEAIVVSGNFGREDPLFAKRGEGKIAHSLKKLRRNMQFFFISPSEFIWMPFYMTWQYFWRRRKGYLYNGR